MTPTPEPAIPLCPHFGTCGGCQHQDLAYPSQLALKEARLRADFTELGVDTPISIAIHSAEPFHYRNRIRLRIETINGTLRLGYNIRTTNDFLPITTCPISAPILFSTGESLLTTATEDPDAAFWLSAASEVELFANHDLTRLQVTLLCAPRTKAAQGSLTRAFNAFQKLAPQIAGLSAIATDPRTGPTGRTLDHAGSPGLNYTVSFGPDSQPGAPSSPTVSPSAKVGTGEAGATTNLSSPSTPPSSQPDSETYWISRGGFFQINRFLLPRMVSLVCQHADGSPRTGPLAWDLFSGVGLFSRILARSFQQVIAVEANPTAAADLAAAFTKIGPQHKAVPQTTLDFLRAAVLQRDRPSLIVLDPPRAGAGLEACALLNRIAAPEIVYVSCDPTTLARDLAVLQPHYRITALHLVDMFPQTSHIETIVILERR